MKNHGRTSASRRSAFFAAAVMQLALLSVPATDAAAQGANIHQRAGGLVSPIGLANAGDGSNRVFIVEQGGCIRFFLLGAVVGTPCGGGAQFLDIRNRIASGGERGLLGLAFHPQYATNGFFFVHYTSLANATPPARNTGDIVISRFSVTADPNVADPTSERILMVIPHSQFSNHNGGQVAFGPDGFLYIATGDGGSGGDPNDNAQNLNSLLGKIHRIDVNEPAAPFYRIPPTNPFQSGGPGTCFNGCDEIWAYGLRNPWRFSFDRLTGDLYIGDVGQSAWEEIDFQPAGAPGGRNYGWDVLEGGLHGPGQVPSGNCHENVPAGACLAMINGGSTLPILEYDRNTGTTVIGGYVYRGRVQNDLWSGSYVFSDFGSGRLWRGFRNADGNWRMEQMFTGLPFITSFGEDDRGNLYFVRSSALWQIFPHSAVAVPPDSSSVDFIERLYAAGLTAGCGDAGYCGSAVATREQVAPLLLRAADGAFVPPGCRDARFVDVPSTSAFCPWIEELARRNAAAGCGGGAYCPEAAVTRAEMAVLTLATLEGPAYAPPACAKPMFADVPAASGFCPWIEELARRGVVAGCGGGAFCPAAPLTRAEMAVFVVATFGLY